MYLHKYNNITCNQPVGYTNHVKLTNNNNINKVGILILGCFATVLHCCLSLSIDLSLIPVV